MSEPVSVGLDCNRIKIGLDLCQFTTIKQDLLQSSMMI